jgi:hypothetical protein
MKKFFLYIYFLSLTNFISGNAVLENPTKEIPKTQINSPKFTPMNSPAKNELLKKLNIAENNLKKTQQELPPLHSELAQQEDKLITLTQLLNQQNPTNKIEQDSLSIGNNALPSQVDWERSAIQNDIKMTSLNIGYLKEKENIFIARVTHLFQLTQKYQQQLQQISSQKK